jgi:hypothetical protein
MSSGEPCPLPKFQLAPRFKILMSSGSKKGTQIYYPFHSESPSKWIPSRFPSGAPMDRDTCLQGIFTSLDIPRFIFPSESPGREPRPCSLTGSPWTVILHHQSHWSVYSFICSFTYVCQSPQTGALQHMGKNIRNPTQGLIDWLNLGSGPLGPDAPRPLLTGPLCPES